MPRHSQLPTWVSTGSWTRATLQQVIETHISNVMTHYRGQCYHWDVVNEAAGMLPSMHCSGFASDLSR